jgi:hypothetical protein
MTSYILSQTCALTRSLATKSGFFQRNMNYAIDFQRVFFQKPVALALRTVPCRIRSPVGDQASAQSQTLENDSDWIKISEFIRATSPRVIDDAQRALRREPWRGEGIAAEAFEDGCVSCIASVEIAFTSPEAGDDVRAVLAALASPTGRPVGSQPSSADSITLGATTLALAPMRGMASTAARLASGGPIARFASLSFAAPDHPPPADASGSGLQDALRARGIRFAPAENGSGGGGTAIVGDTGAVTIAATADGLRGPGLARDLRALLSTGTAAFAPATLSIGCRINMRLLPWWEVCAGGAAAQRRITPLHHA